MSLRVCYCATGPFIELALYSAASLFLATARAADIEVELFVGTDELQGAAKKTKRLRQEHGWTVNVRSMSLVVPADALSAKIRNDYFFRFALPELFPGDDCLIYLDADTIVTGDITSLADQRPDGFAVSACLDLFAPSRIYDHFNCAVHRQRGLCDYLNSGVLLFDCPRWNDAQPAWRAMLDRQDSLLYPDQDVLNLVLHDAIGRLPDDWNVPPVAAFLAGGSSFGDTIGRYSREDMLELERTAKLHHFIGNTKPGSGKHPEVGASFENFHAITRRVAF